MSIKARLRPLHLRLRKNTVYDGLYLLVRPKARYATPKSVSKPKATAKITAAQKETLVSEGKAEVVRELMASGDTQLAKSVLARLLRDDGNAKSSPLWAAKAELALSQADHKGLGKITSEMTEKLEMPIGHFYAAQSLLSRGKYDDALAEIQLLLHAEPNHADGIYLMADMAMRTGERQLALDALYRLALVSHRPKTWLCLANLQETQADFMHMQHAWQKWTTGLTKGAYKKDAREYLALGAMRVGNYRLAKTIWRESLMSAAEVGFETLRVRKPSYSSNRAEDALSDLNATLRAADIEMFLVSGTLLGCIREGKLLGHDKDIDVGIWSDVSHEDFFKAIHKSGQFMVLASRSEHIIRLKHLNGIAVDIFFHYRDPKDYWHAGVKMKWSNTPFKLVEKEFLGQTHLIPEDYDLYLKENYGDWKTPKIAFDSAFDTPNGSVLSEDEMVIHALKGLQNACIAGNPGTPDIYLEDLIKRGEARFVGQFKKHLKTADPRTAALIKS